MFGFSVQFLLVLLFACRLHDILNRPLPTNIEDTRSFRLLDECLNIGDYLVSKGLEYGINLADYRIVHIFADKALRLLTSPKWNDKISNVQVSELKVSSIHVKVFRVQKRAGSAKEHLLPAIVYFHGGGWTWFSPDAYENFLLSLANKTQITIFAVDYRKAPAHPFPAAYCDCLQVTKYVSMNARTLNVDPSFLMVAGDGAGGNLAAAVARKMASKIFLQVLINPALQSLDFQTPSYVDNYNSLAGMTSADRVARHWQFYANLTGFDQSAFLSNRHVLPDTKRRYFQYIDSKNYLPRHLNVTSRESIPDFDLRVNQPISERWQPLLTDVRFSPSLAHNVSGLPNAYIVTSQYDVLRDEAIMYADRLLKSGVKIRLKHYTHAFHGFLVFSSSWAFQTKVSQQALNDLISFFHVHIK